MTAVTKSETKARTFGRNIESDLASRFLRVVETAAIASAHTMGQGERKLSDQVATEAMRKTMDSIPMHGTIADGKCHRKRRMTSDTTIISRISSWRSVSRARWMRSERS